MNPNAVTLEKLFGPQLRYVVPMFQRIYVWDENPQWMTLWEDVAEKADLRVSDVDSAKHYLGALIVEGVKPTSSNEVKRFLVIDGQQRITTLQLLLIALRDVARKSGWKAIDKKASRYLENADPDLMEKPEEEALKLWPTTLNREVFRAIATLGSRDAIDNAYPLVFLPRKRKPEPRSPLVRGYLYFGERIEAWVNGGSSQEDASREGRAFKLLQAIEEDFCLVEIALSENDDSQEIFYSLNSQGRPLSQSDLLRSLIFMRAEKEKLNRDALFDDYWSRFETPFWSQEVKRAGRSYSRLDLGLRFFLSAKKTELIDARRVSEEYRAWVTSAPPKYASVRDELEDFSRYAEGYRRYEEAPASLPSSDFRRVVTDFDVSTLLPLALYLENEGRLSGAQLAGCFAVLESFVARRAFVGEDNKEYNKFFVEILSVLRGLGPGELEGALTRKLLSGGGSTRRWPTDAEMIESALSREVGTALRLPALRFTLERLEASLRTKKTEEAEVPTGLQVEHVLPRSWAANWPLGGHTIPPNIVAFPFLAAGEIEHLQEEVRARNSNLQTIGNLTLLNQSLNPAVGNAPYGEKRDQYRNSVLRLNRYFDQQGEWEDSRIRERSRELANLLCGIWARPKEAEAAPLGG